MNKVNISAKDRRWMGFFLSMMILSAYISIMGDITHNFMSTTTTVEGTVSEYTLDSIFVDVNWLVEYEHSKLFSETDLLEMRVFIKGMMKEDIKELLNNTPYREYFVMKQTKQIRSGDKATVILFNN